MRLRPGMTARITIATQLAVDVLTVPIQAVFDNSQGKFCYTFDGQKFQKQAVRIGKHNEERIEILSGLKAGERVSLVLPSPREVL